MRKGWKRFANIRVTAVAGSIGAMLMVWTALFNRDQASQTEASQPQAVASVQTSAAATPTPSSASNSGSAVAATPAATATPRPTTSQLLQPQTRTRGS